MSEKNSLLTISLSGNIAVSDPEGSALQIKGKGSVAVLATLAVASDMKRSRDWLKATIWSRADEPHCSYSLRSELCNLRKQLREFKTCLRSDRTHVWLEDVELEPFPGQGNDFFEDAPRTLGEPFDDWLRQQSANFLEAVDRSSGQNLALRPMEEAQEAQRPCVVVMPAHFVTNEPAAEVVAEFVLSQVIDMLRVNGMIDVFDLRDLDQNQLETFDNRLPTMDGLLRLRVSNFGTETHFGIQCLQPISRRVDWSSSLTADRSSSFAISADQLAQFANQAAESVQLALLRRAMDSKSGRRREGVDLFAAVHQIQGMSLPGQDTARNLLRSNDLVYRSPAAAAWYCLSFANSIGESDPQIVPEMLEELEENCIKALALDPSNPVTLAIVSHVEGFVFRRLQRGAELGALSRQIAPYLAMAWDLSAMNAVYRGDEETAFEYAQTAQRLGGFSPYKVIFDSSLAISATVTDRHELAIRVGKAILKQRPSYLAVMRHMVASMAAIDDADAAREMIHRVQEFDPNFMPSQLSDPRYPLPSTASIEKIKQGFQSTGLLKG